MIMRISLYYDFPMYNFEVIEDDDREKYLYVLVKIAIISICQIVSYLLHLPFT